jgi:hypothetical protein
MHSCALSRSLALSLSLASNLCVVESSLTQLLFSYPIFTMSVVVVVVVVIVIVVPVNCSIINHHQQHQQQQRLAWRSIQVDVEKRQCEATRLARWSLAHHFLVAPVALTTLRATHTPPQVSLLFVDLVGSVYVIAMPCCLLYMLRGITDPVVVIFSDFCGFSSCCVTVDHLSDDGVLVSVSPCSDCVL